MNLSAMTLADLTALQDALGLVQRAAIILDGLPDCGEGSLVVQMRPGEPVTVVTSWVLPAVRPVAALAPGEFEAMARSLAVAMPVQAKAAMQHAAALCAASADSGDRSEAAVKRAEALSPKGPEQPAVGGDAAGKAGGGSRKVAAPRVKRAQVLVAGRVTGPLSDDERATILARMDKESSASIALDLKRRTQEVSLFIYRLRHGKVTKAGPVQAEGQAKHVEIDRAADVALVLTGGPAADASAPDTGPAPAAARDAEFCAATPSGPIRDDIEMVQAPRVVVEIVPPAPPPSPALVGVIDPRPARQRAIGEMLDGLKPRKGFDPDLDLELVEALVGGGKLDVVAVDLGLDSADIKLRWRDLTQSLLDIKGRLAVDDQTYLLTELRRKVREARSRAA